MYMNSSSITNHSKQVNLVTVSEVNLPTCTATELKPGSLTQNLLSPNHSNVYIIHYIKHIYHNAYKLYKDFSELFLGSANTATNSSDAFDKSSCLVL